MSEWISVEDRLPEKSGGIYSNTVLVRSENGDRIFLAYTCGGDSDWVSITGGIVQDGIIKWWMPLDALPEPPEGE